MDISEVLFFEWSATAKDTRDVKKSFDKITAHLRTLDLDYEQYNKIEPLITLYGYECKRIGFSVGYGIFMEELKKYGNKKSKKANFFCKHCCRANNFLRKGGKDICRISKKYSKEAILRMYGNF